MNETLVRYLAGGIIEQQRNVALIGGTGTEMSHAAVEAALSELFILDGRFGDHRVRVNAPFALTRQGQVGRSVSARKHFHPLRR